VQSPPHPAKTQPAAGVAVSVTAVPEANGAVQVPEAAPFVMVHVTPGGDDDTVPDPVPVTAMLGAIAVNCAVTVWAVLSVTLQLPVAEHAPVQPANVLPALGNA